MVKVPEDYQVDAVKVTNEERNIVGGNIAFSVKFLTPQNVIVSSALPTGSNIIGKVKITDGSYIAGVDPLGYLIAIEIEHYKVHEGNFYTVSDYDNDVDTASPKYWHIKTHAGDVRVHIRIQVATDTGGLLELFENPTTTGDGTPLTPYNNDRNSGNTSVISFYYDPTVSADGTRIEVTRIGGGM